MTVNEKGGMPPQREIARADELEGASSHRSFRGARAPGGRSEEDPPATEKNAVRPEKGELSPRD
jgi:hypothetical protein